MGVITNLYKKNFLQRYDKDGVIPFYCAADFPGLVLEEGSFQNSADTEIHYFTYCYEGYRTDRLILFCHGLGPGHTAYLAEIDTLCKAGFKVLALDYTGCDASGGDKLSSCNAPTRDVIELLELLDPKEEIIPVGHSLGGYTALNVAHLRPDVTRAVILSGFMNISDLMMGFVKLRILADRVKQYEKKLDAFYGTLDNRAYLRTTTDKILWIHSSDDPVVDYRFNAVPVVKLGNPNVRVITVEQKKHNPQYTKEALDCMNAWIGEYTRLVKEKQLETLEAKQAFFADKPIGRMTAQDPAVYEEILNFIGA